MLRNRKGFVLLPWLIVAAWVYVGGMFAWMAGDIYSRCVDCGVNGGSSSTAPAPNPADYAN